MKKIVLGGFVLALLFGGCVSKTQKENTISLSGAFALYPMTIKWADAYKKEHPEIRFNISAGGAGKGMADALAGTVDLGMFSREIAQAEIDKGVWWVGLCKDAVLPTLSAQNPYLDIIKKRGITREELKAIFVDYSIQNWPELVTHADNKVIQVYTRSDACGAAGTWAKYLGFAQEDLKGIGIHGDPGLADAVAKDKYGIGFNNTAYVYDIKTGEKYPGLEVLPLDLDANGTLDAEEDFYDSFEQVLAAIAEGKYPSPPARELYFVAHGKPAKKAVLDFMKWTLTTGQQYVKEAGYVPITQEKLNAYLKELEEE